MIHLLSHHPVLRDFLSNCAAQIIGGLVSSVAVIWMFKHREELDL